MLDSLRNAAKSWLIKLLMFVLVLSFALWGINDVYFNVTQGSLIEAGETTVSEQEFTDALDRELQALSQQTGQPFTREQARLLGFDQNLLRRFVSEAVLNEQARRMNLGRSDQAIVRGVLSATNLSPSELQMRLAEARISEAQFIASERAASARRQIIEGLVAAPVAPGVIVDALHQFSAETRKATYVTFGPAALGEIPEPDQAALEAYYNENKASFRAPEYRTFATVRLDAATLAKSIEISDEEARRAYESQKNAYVDPEKRAVDQILFESEEKAREASERIKAGTATFDAVAAERNLSPESVSLGTLPKSGFVEKAVGDAAFALPEGGVSGPVSTGFGTVLVRVRKIEAGSVKPFEQVRDEIKPRLAARRAQQDMLDVYDRIDDERAGGASLSSIAEQFKLELRRFENIDRQSKGQNGEPVANPPETAVLNAAFDTDPGVEASPAQIGDDAYVWYDVEGVTPARDRPLEEVRSEAVKRWKEQETRNQLAALAETVANEVKGGKTFETIATERGGLEVKEAGPFRRTETPDPFSASATQTVFATPPNGVAHAVAQDGTSRIVFRVGEATVPPLADDQRKPLVDRVEAALSDDLLAQYVNWLQKDIGVTINPQILARIFGQPS